MRPIDWKTLVELCEGEGCLRDRERGDHYIMTKPGLARPVVIPKKKASPKTLFFRWEERSD